MDTTPNHGFDKPGARGTGPSVNEIRDALRDNADLLDILVPKLVTALPGSPVDGQGILLQTAAMATKGLVWPLRYNATSASPYKWEGVGCAPWIEEIADQESTSSSTYTDLGTVGPTVTAPLAGEYIVRTAAFISMFSPELGSMSFAKGATTAIAGDSIQASLWAINSLTPTAGSHSGSYSRELLTTVTAAATALTAKYKNVGGGGASFAERSLSIVPVRVG